MTYKGWRCRWGCIFLGLLMMLACLAAGIFLFYWVKPSDSNSDFHNSPSDTDFGTGVRFDCDAGFWNWEKGWSTAKKHWCCDKVARGCPRPTAPPSLPYDCKAGFYNWRAGWSERKKHWCCRHFHRGCPERTYYSAPYDCDADPVLKWTKGKKLWCCHKFQRGCHPDVHIIVESDPYDCHAGLSNWQNGWSEHKKTWCCDNKRLGCPPHRFVETVDAKYDCSEGYSHWRKDWEPEKQYWCCHHAGRGCDTIEHVRVVSEPYDCNAGYSNWQKGWSEAKKVWCCEHKDLGCLHKEEPYDCKAGLANWQAGWSVPKKEWCCTKSGVGCDISLGCDTKCEYEGETHTCRDRITWAASHLDGEANSCAKGREKVLTECAACSACSLEHSECHDAEASSDPYDCDAGYSNWAAGWSDAKKSWCCDHTQKACTGVDPPSVHAPHGKVWKQVMYGGGKSWQLVSIHHGHEVVVIHEDHTE